MNRAERRRQEKIARGSGAASVNMDMGAALQQAVQFHKQGDLAHAEQIYRNVLKSAPNHPETNHLLGTLAHQLGRHKDALVYLEKAANASPANANFHNMVGIVAKAAGDLEKAQLSCEKALACDPNFAVAHNSLALVLKEKGQLDDALNAVKKAIALAPNLIEAHNNLGHILLETEAPEDAVAAFKTCLEINPNFVMARYNCALALQRMGEKQQALDFYKQVIKAQPQFAEAYANCGELLRGLGQFEEAITALQKAAELAPNSAQNYYNLGLALADIGQNAEAAACFEGAIKIKPDFAFAYNDHGNAILALGHAKQAIPSFKKAIDLAPDVAGIHNNLGHAYIRNGELELGKKALTEAIGLDVKYARAYNNMGVVHQEYGQFDEAQKMFSTALALNPDYSEANSNLLFTINYHPTKSGEEIFEHYKDFSRKMAEKVPPQPRQFTNQINPNRRIRVGYVAPTFYKHAVSYHLMPLFDNCTHDDFEVFAYADIEKVDEYTRQYQSNCDHFRHTKGYGDQQLADLIAEDQIDILVDIAGHTRKNRLGVFARKPAPVALHWLDFGYTTGMAQIDYYLGDKNVTPVGQDHLFGEKQVWRLDGPSVAYRAPDGMGEVSELPALKNGYITFCTLSRTVRLNDKTLNVWAEILKRVPGSKLRFDSRNFGHQEMCDRIADKMAEFGIERDRLILGFNSPPWDVLREIDIALDCFPHNSGTTLFEHLYMGNPFVTLYNRASVGTLGGAILRGGGFGEWVAHDEAQYIDIATQLAGDVEALQQIRASMREKMKASPLMDEKAFVARVEVAYRDMWRRWCKEQ